MENIIDLITRDESPSEISDAIKDVLFSKASEKIDMIRPEISSALFNSVEEIPEVEEE